MTSIESTPTISMGSTRLTLPITQITITKEVLLNHMSKVYEKGVRNAEKFHWGNLGPYCMSVSLTLLIPCLTASFKDYSAHVSFATASFITTIAWVSVVVSFIVGGVFLCLKSSCKHGRDYEERDKAVGDGADALLSQLKAVSDDSSE